MAALPDPDAEDASDADGSEDGDDDAADDDNPLSPGSAAGTC
jgi:hypothetical protein